MAKKRSRTAQCKRPEKPKRPHAGARAAARHSHTDAGPDRIVCLLCGETYRVVSYWHLKRIHGFEGDHPVHDYKEMFGLRVAACEEFCDRSREVQIEYHTREGRHLTRSQVLKRIRELAGRGRPLARARVHTGLSDAGIRIFGSWDDALRAAGEDPLDHRLLGGWTRESILVRVKEVAQDAPMGDRRAFLEQPRLYALAMREFGSWSRALEAAGHDPTDHRDERYWTLDQAEAWVRDRHKAGASFRASATPGGVTQFVARETGQTWVEFVESLGIPYPPYARREPWTDAEVIEKIRARSQRGAQLNMKHIIEDGDNALVRQAGLRFGSWDAALSAAGVDPNQVRLKRPWTREDVVEAIRDRHARGLPLLQERVTEEDRRIVVAAGKLWPRPRPWLRALRAAGIDPAQAAVPRAGGPVRRRRK